MNETDHNLIVFDEFLRNLTTHAMITDKHISVLEESKKNWQNSKILKDDSVISAQCLEFYDIMNSYECFVGNTDQCIKYKELNVFFDNLIIQTKKQNILNMWEMYVNFKDTKLHKNTKLWIQKLEEQQSKKSKEKIKDLIIIKLKNKDNVSFTYPKDLMAIRSSFAHPYISNLQNNNQNLNLKQHRKMILSLAFFWVKKSAEVFKQPLDLKYLKIKTPSVQNWNNFCQKIEQYLKQIKQPQP